MTLSSSFRIFASIFIKVTQYSGRICSPRMPTKASAEHLRRCNANHMQVFKFVFWAVYRRYKPKCIRWARIPRTKLKISKINKFHKLFMKSQFFFCPHIHHLDVISAPLNYVYLLVSTIRIRMFIRNSQFHKGTLCTLHSSQLENN